MIGIYSITNTINGKQYIGQSVNIESRWRSHRSSIHNSDTYHYPLYRAIRKYGLDNFKFEVLEECLVSELNEKEVHYINEKNSFKKGYNQTLGGHSPWYRALSYEQIEEVIQHLQEDQYYIGEIAQIYDVNREVISNINNGITYKQDISYPIRNGEIGKRQGPNHCETCNVVIDIRSKKCKECQVLSRRTVERPAKDKLLEEVALYGFAATGRKYGVTSPSIRKWLKAYNLPTKIKPIRQLHGNYVGNTKMPDHLVKNKDFSLTNGKVTKTFSRVEGAVRWFQEQELTKAKASSIRSGINNILAGRRKSYLGFKVLK